MQQELDNVSDAAQRADQQLRRAAPSGNQGVRLVGAACLFLHSTQLKALKAMATPDVTFSDCRAPHEAASHSMEASVTQGRVLTA